MFSFSILLVLALKVRCAHTSRFVHGVLTNHLQKTKGITTAFLARQLSLQQAVLLLQSLALDRHITLGRPGCSIDLLPGTRRLRARPPRAALRARPLEAALCAGQRQVEAALVQVVGHRILLQHHPEPCSLPKGTNHPSGDSTSLAELNHSSQTLQF
jgi:hypothetical protein